MVNRLEKCPVFIPPMEVKDPEPSVERDFLIVRQIYEYDGILTKDQIFQLVKITDGPFNQRMRRLVNHGFIHRMEKWKRDQYNFSAYWLAERGARYVAGLAGEEHTWRDYCFRESRKWKGTRSPRFDNLIHDIRIVDYRLAVESACTSHPGLVLREWVKQSVLKADPDRVNYKNRNNRDHSRNFIPDGFYIIDDTQQRRLYRFLFEMDNGVKDGHKMLDEKLLIGTAYVGSALYENRFNSKQGWYIFVCADDRGNSLQRVQLLKRYIEQYRPDHAKYFFFTTLDLIQTAENVITVPIWWRGNTTHQVPLIIVE